MGLTPFPPDTRLTLHPLVVRRHGSEFIVGRTETGIFVSIPPTGLRILETLQDGHTLEQIEALLAAEGNGPLDLPGFTADLIDLGFVRAINDQPPARADPAPEPVPWLEPQQARRFFSRAAILLWAGLLVAAVVSLILRAAVLPPPTAFFWSPALSMVLVVNLVFWVFHRTMHEFAHLTAARAAGIPFQIRTGKRHRSLRFHADVSGAWALPRAARDRIHAAGLLWDLGLTSVLILTLTYAPLPDGLRSLLGAWLILAIVALAGEFRLFGKSDLHEIWLDRFPVQDPFGELRRRLRRANRPRQARDPLPAAVGRYLPAFLVSSALVIVAGIGYAVPVVIQLIERALAQLAAGLPSGDPSLILDGSFALVATAVGLAFAIDAVRHRGRPLSPSSATPIRRRFRQPLAAAEPAPPRDVPAHPTQARP